VSFYDQTKPVPSGLVRTYKGIDVVTMGAANGVTIDDVKIKRDSFDRRQNPAVCKGAAW
jgi:hypothetical protein